MIIKLPLILLIHLVFFLSYPHTGPMGRIYLIISALFWCGALIFFKTSLFFAKILGGLAGRLVTIVFFSALVACLAATMPQSDDIAVLKKFKRGIYPDKESVSHGLRSLSRTCGALLKRSSKDLKIEVRQNINKLKK